MNLDAPWIPIANALLARVARDLHDGLAESRRAIAALREQPPQDLFDGIRDLLRAHRDSGGEVLTILPNRPQPDLAQLSPAGAEAIALAEELRPDVVLMDLRMPGLSGAEATAQLTRSSPSARILVLTTFADDASIDSALRAGAAGYPTKDAGREEMIAAIRATADGGAPLDTRIAGRVVAGLPEARPTSVRDRFPELTGREAEVLELIAEGASNPEIAERLFLGVSTVRSHINALFAKLGVSRRQDAITRVREDDQHGHSSDR